MAPHVELGGRRVWPFYTEEACARVNELAREGRVYSVGDDPDVQLFEAEFAASLRGSGHMTLLCNSGTSALLAAYFGLAIPLGSDVLVPTNTFQATATPLLLLGCRPVLYDCAASSGNVDFDDVESRITPDTAALVVTHAWGHPCDMTRAQAVATRHGLALIEDCSHAHGAEYRGRPVGTFGDVAVFSVGTKKLVSGGAGGVLVTKHRDVYERALVLGFPAPQARREVRGPLAPYAPTGFGTNLRPTPMAAVLARDHLVRLSQLTTTKNDNLQRLDAHLPDVAPWVGPPARSPEFTNGTWYGYRCVTALDRELRARAVELLRRQGCPVSLPSPLLHRHALFADMDPTSPFGRHAVAPTDLAFPGGDAWDRSVISFDLDWFHEPAHELIDAIANVIAWVTEQLQLGEHPRA